MSTTAMQLRDLRKLYSFDRDFLAACFMGRNGVDAERLATKAAEEIGPNQPDDTVEWVLALATQYDRPDVMFVDDLDYLGECTAVYTHGDVAATVTRTEWNDEFPDSLRVWIDDNTEPILWDRLDFVVTR